MSEVRSVNLVSVRAFASQINVSEGGVRKAIKAGSFKIGVDPVSGKIDPVAAQLDDWVIKQTVIRPKAGVSRALATEKMERTAGLPRSTPAVAGPEADGDDDELSEDLGELDVHDGDLASKIKIHLGLSQKKAYQLKEIVALAIDTKKLQELEGALVRRDAVEKTLFVFGNELKKALFNLPQRIARDVMAASTEVEAINIINTEITRLLESFGGFRRDLR